MGLFDIAGESFHIDCYGLTLASFDMVLGAQWLESLGPILSDFSHRIMAFVQDGCCICWIGVETRDQSAVLMTVEAELMDDLLCQFAQLFSPPQGLPLPR
jgi:hypothetical protein